MQSATADVEAGAARRVRASNDLVNLTAPIIELILKLRSRAVEPSHEVRPVVEDLLRQVEEGSVQLRCPPSSVYDVKFALVAFLDETMLSPENNFPLRPEWESHPLQLQYFKEHLAGMKFFERLEEMLVDVEANADVVEVYYLCLVLGYKGKYNIYLLEGQRREVMVRVEGVLRWVGRLQPNALSAHWQAGDQPTPPRNPGLPLWVKVGAPSLLALALLIYLALYMLLQQELTIVR